MKNLKINKLLRPKYIITLALVMFSMALMAQPVIETPNPVPSFTGAPGTTFNIILETDSSVYVPYDNGWVITWPGIGNDPTGWLSGTSTSETLTLEATPPIEAEGIYFFNARVDDGPVGDDPTDSDTKQFTIQISRKPVDVIFCIDISGSMGSNADPECVGSCDSRLEALQASMEMIIDLWNNPGSDYFDEDDRIGVIYFDSDADSPPDNLPLADLQDEASTVKSHINSRTDGGSTAMGAALQMAVSQLAPNPDRSQNIILFTDGEQNRNPMVNVTTLEIANEGGRSPAEATEMGVTLGADATLPAAHIKVYTIGMGSSSAKALLDKIATDTGVTPDLLMDNNDFNESLPEAYLNQLIDALKEGSPQIAMWSLDNLTGTSATETVRINDNVDNINFMLYGNRSDELGFRVLKDGTDVSEIGSAVWRNGRRHTIYSLTLPAINSSGDTIKSGGEWSLQIQGGAGENASYQVWGIVEEKNINYQASVGGLSYQSGDTVELSLELDHRGNPLADATVTVRALRPGDDLGHLLATTKTPDGGGAGEADISDAEKKYQDLISDPDFASKLAASDQVFSLTSNGDGSYSGTFTDTEVTGPYRFIFEIKGTHPQTGDFVRIVTKSTMVDFGSMDIDNSEIITVVKGDAVVALQLRPKNTFGYFIGPGMSDYINISIPTGSIGQPQDNLDGTYSYPITGLSIGDQAQFTITVFDDTVFKGKITPEGPEDSDNGDFFTDLPWWVWLILIVIILLAFIIRRSKS